MSTPSEKPGLPDDATRRAVHPSPAQWSRVAWCVIVLALVTGAALRLSPELFEIPPVRWDAMEYHLAAHEILETGVYANHSREPLFPYLLALSYRVLGDDLVTQLRVLGMLSILSMLLGVLLMRRTFPDRSGWLAAAAVILWAVDGDQLAFVRELYSSSLQGVLLAAALLALVSGVQRASVSRCIAAGVCIGLLGLTRGVWTALAFPAALLAIQGSAEGRWRRGFAVLAATAVLVLPWMVRNQTVHGFFAPASLSGVQAFLRTWHLKPDGDEGRVVRETAAVVRERFPDRDGPGLSGDIAFVVYGELIERGMSRTEANEQFMAMARESLLARPGPYLFESAVTLTRLLGTYDFTWLSDDYLEAMDQPIEVSIEQGRWPIAAAEVFFRFAVPLLAMAALLVGLALSLRRRQAGRVVLIGMALALLFGLALVANAVAIRRYRSDLDVVLLPAIALGVAVTLERFRRAAPGRVQSR